MSMKKKSSHANTSPIFSCLLGFSLCFFFLNYSNVEVSANQADDGGNREVGGGRWVLERQVRSAPWCSNPQERKRESEIVIDLDTVAETKEGKMIRRSSGGGGLVYGLWLMATGDLVFSLLGN